jgi:murein hydrolase activator
MLRVCKYLLILLFTLGVVWFSNGQSRVELQRMIEKNKNDIKLTREILRETQNQKVASLQLLNVYQNQIISRKALISGIGSEVESIDIDIEIAREEISAITKELNDMKSEFRVLIQDGYKSQKNHSKILFLFSSNNFNQLFKRMHYLRKLLDYRKLQLELILRKQQENSYKVNALVNKKNEKLVLLRNREAEQGKLISDQNREEEIIYALKEKEADLLISIRQKQKQANELDKMVKQIIERENNKDFVPASSEELSVNFESNRGRLPWPVKNGYINEIFGVHKHAELKNITTENNGINITTTPGSEVFPVFGGTVVAIMEVPGLKNSVLVKHTGYYTVYANLEEVFIKRGDQLQVGGRIGRVVKDEDGLAELHFEVWKGTNKLDPQRWLRN